LKHRQELARVLALESDILLAFMGTAETVVRAYREAYHQHIEKVIQLFLAAQ
jgi:hypothetical protein